MSVQIEATSKCNLRCPQCSHSRESDSGHHLTPGEFQKILDRLPFPIKHLILSGIGEPLLNPDFFSLIDILAERQITCQFFTNGTLLTARKCDSILARTNIKSVVISCDSAHKNTFESLRFGANFEIWRQLVHHFTIKAKEERPDLRIGMNTVITKQNLNELEEIISFAADLGVNSVHFIDPVPIDEVAATYVPSPTEFSSIHLDELYNLGRSRGLNVTWWIRRDTLLPKVIPRCLLPWEYIFIRTNGDISPCPALFSTENAAIMGNIFREEFYDIWTGDRFREFRSHSVKGTNSQCRVCPYN